MNSVLTLSVMWMLIAICCIYVAKWPRSERRLDDLLVGAWKPLRRRWPMIRVAWFVLVPVTLMAMHWFTRESWSRPSNAWASAVLQILGAWIVFYAVSKPLGGESWKLMFSAAKDWWVAFLHGSAQSAQYVLLGQAGEFSTADSLRIKVKRQKLEDRVEELEREVEGLHERIDKESASLRRRFDKKLADLKGEIEALNNGLDNVRTDVEAATWSMVKLELFGALLFTHGIIAGI